MKFLSQILLLLFCAVLSLSFVNSDSTHQVSDVATIKSNITTSDIYVYLRTEIRVHDNPNIVVLSKIMKNGSEDWEIAAKRNATSSFEDAVHEMYPKLIANVNFDAISFNHTSLEEAENERNYKIKQYKKRGLIIKEVFINAQDGTYTLRN